MEVEVSDSTDWLGTPLASLKSVEEALRCHVCKDFFTTPMLTSCSHTFCSLCIRRCLTADSKCPLCRKTVDLSKLRGNGALREAVEAFRGVRDSILKFARTPTPALPISPKRKATDVDNSDDEFQESKRPRRSTRNRKAREPQASSQLTIEDSEGDLQDDNDGEDEYVPEPTASRSITSALRSPSKRPPAAAAKAPERLPTLQYSMVKDQALRKIMRELGLSTAGNRTMLEARHREWLTLWNANCDSANPKTRGALFQDLQVWERTIGTMAPTSSKAASTGAQIKDKDFDGGAWAAKHDSSFKDLIANARRSRQIAEQKAREAAAEEAAKQEASSSVPQPSVPKTSTPSTAESAPLPQTPVLPVQPPPHPSYSHPERWQHQPQPTHYQQP
ncbi:uncharacterized protein PODANS_1_24110 [Podospora anserina S mat+]|uniref:Postreplication repair E3 ubiquitin-protein ligase RAD18 n=1 Tax=Podospora anserina (strain S / ATCC MYA-4624 / DSM 980 / FGSC 10383) TaxID=515849 RepID=B2ASN6_PODAN|nr:uncharacterized protein PODANS_1_24110 [Podospora anserina S mat+]CAP67409.1 unnamed protein product [Podospora anserina S mat+]CDP24823.1 Putative postreplication repair E3 ubiquitin-protein ligase rad-18 [Podospora anserina S mat+]